MNHPRPIKATPSSTSTGWPPWVLACAAAFLGLLLTAAAYRALNDAQQRQEQAAFERQSMQLIRQIKDRFQRVELGLNAARGLYVSHRKALGPTELRDYVASLNLKRDLPGVLGFGFAERRRIKDSASPGYTSAYVVRNFEPVIAEAPALGMDINLNVTLRNAIENAEKNRSFGASAPVLINSTKASEPAVYLFLPVYPKPSDKTTSRVDVNSSAEGIVFAPMLLSDLLGSGARVQWPTLSFTLYDSARIDPAKVVYHQDADGPVLQDKVLDEAIVIGGRVFSIAIKTSIDSGNATGRQLPALAAALGLLISLLMGGCIWLLLSGRQQAIIRANRMTKDLQRLAQVSHQTTNAVVMTDIHGCITWVNPGFEQVSGLQGEAVLGRSLIEVVNQQLQCKDIVDRIREALDSGLKYHGSCQWTTAGGQVVYLGIQCQPVFNDGKIEGCLLIAADNTEVMLGAMTLEKDRARLESILASGRSGAGEWNVQTGEVKLDEQWAKLVGYAPQDIETLTMNAWSEMIHPDDLAASTQLMLDHFEGKTPNFECEIRVKHRDGHWVCMLSRGRVTQRDAFGRPLWVCGTHVDVTDLRESESQWRARAELSGDWFWQTDEEHRFSGIETNAHHSRELPIARFFGKRRDEIDGMSAPEGGWQGFYALLDQHQPFKGVTYSVELPDGKIQWVEIDGRPRYSQTGLYVGYEGIGRDVTERSLQRHALEESLRLNDALFEGIPVPVVLKDPQGRYLKMNRIYQELFPPNATDLAPETVSSLVNPEAALIHNTVDRELLSTPGTRTYELSQTTTAGNVLDVLVCKSTLVDKHGKILGLIGTVVDVSTQREAMRSLALAKDAAESATRAKSAFLATMSHEIRTPMNGIIGMAELMAATPQGAEAAESTRTILESSRALLDIIDDILDFSKIEADKVEIDSTPTPIWSLLESICAGLHSTALAQDVELNLSISPQVPGQLVLDPSRVRQILNNLLSNAIKFSGRKAKQSGRVLLRTSVELGERAELVFQVIDNGVGISPEALLDLFEPFMQAERSTTRRFGGTGLGLAITKRLAELMGGGISVESQVGEGSTFRVALPLDCTEDDISVFGDELAGMRCAVVDHPRYSKAMVGELFTALGVQVMHYACFEDMEKDLPHQALPLIVIMADESNIRTRIGELRKNLGFTPYLRFLLIGHGQRTQVRLESEFLGHMDVVRPLALAKAVAVMGGRAATVPEDPLESAVDPNLESMVDTDLTPGMSIQILVAEDDPTNRKVLQKQLKALGYSSIMCENGAEALEAWRTYRFSMVLTDLHMPIMDGYALASAIRMEEAGKTRIPIIALTANAVRGEASRAIECGMDEYLSKPIPLGEMQLALKRWCDKQVVVTQVDAAANPAANIVLPSVLDTSALAKMVGPDPEVQAEVIGDFLQESEPMVAALAEALEKANLKAAQAVAHRLKSASRWVGGFALGRLCETFETRTSPVDDLVLASDRLAIEAAYQQLVKALEEASYRPESRSPTA